jgi:hypothetical protein
MKQMLKLAVLLLALGMIVGSCKKVATNRPNLTSNPTSNLLLVANGGDDQTITLPTDSAVLDASASKGAIRSFHWIEIAGPTSTNILNINPAKILVKPLVVGVYQFELTITDNSGVSAKDTVQIVVEPDVKPVFEGEYRYDGLVWQYDVDGAANLYIGIEPPPEPFFSDRPVEVLVKSETDNEWTIDQLFHYPNSSAYVYSIYANTLWVFPYPHVFPWSANSFLAGKKVSVRVKFL